MHFRPRIKTPRIHWKKYIERKCFVLLALVIVTFVMETWFHDFSIAVFFEHAVFGIPFEEI